MAAYKDFDAALNEQEKEPVRFRLGGEDFQIDSIKAGPLLRLARMSDAEDADALLQFDSFLTSLIRKEDHKRWAEVLDKVSTDTLLEVVQFIVEESAGRPTELPSASPERQRTSGRRSNTGTRKSAKKTA